MRSVAFYLFIVENVEDIHTHFALSASPCYSFEYLETLKRGCNKIANLWAHWRKQWVVLFVKKLKEGLQKRIVHSFGSVIFFFNELLFIEKKIKRKRPKGTINQSIGKRHIIIQQPKNVISYPVFSQDINPYKLDA